MSRTYFYALKTRSIKRINKERCLNESPQRVNVNYELLGHIAFSDSVIVRSICIMRLGMIVTKT